MAAKKTPKFQMSDDHRRKIQNSCILKALIEHVEGKRELTSTQVTAGLGLLRKIMPDLASTTIEGTGEGGSILFKTVYEAKPKDK